MNKTKQLLITVIILNTALIGAYGFLFYLIKQKSDETSVLYQDIQGQQANQEQLTTLRHELNDTEAERAMLASYSVKSSDLNAFIKSLESLGEESGTDMRLNAFIETNANSLLVDLSATGTYDDMYYLVKLIEHLPYHIEFRKAYFNSLGMTTVSSPDKKSTGQKEKTRSTWDANINIELFGYSKE